jgi:aspartate/methionine/tyrosine aminotransferase
MSTETGRAMSVKAASFTESVSREMTRLSALHGAINLGQGFPDFPAPFELKEAASRRGPQPVPGHVGSSRVP